MDASKVSPTRAAASKAYAAATKINTRLASSIPAGDVCVVCLHACGTKACACSHMHEQCAASYIKWSGSPLCRVCNGEIVVKGLSKRPRELEEESEAEVRAKRRLGERQAAERAEAVEWAQSFAPSAARIVLRHFSHSRGSVTARAEAQQMGFDAVILSLVHSGPEYTDDLREDLSNSWSPSEVESRMRKLHDLADNMSSDGVLEECSSAFMRIFAEKVSRLPVPPIGAGMRHLGGGVGL